MVIIKPHSSEAWHEHNAESEVFRDFYRPAYHDAFAPVVASSIDFQSRVLGKRVVKVLVVGGGKGVFSEKVLPASLELFNSTPPKIEVVETDTSEVLSQAPKTAVRVRADARALPFQDGSFDLVFGESMIHHQGPQGVMDIVKEVGRVLKPDGMFFHVQDVGPNDDWLKLRESTLTKSGSLNVIGAKRQLLDAVDRRVIRAIGEAAAKNKMSFLSRLISGEEHLDLQEIAKKYGVSKGKVTSNDFVFLTGRASSYFDSSLPKGLARLRYSGHLAIASKCGKLKKFIGYAHKHFQANITRAKG